MPLTNEQLAEKISDSDCNDCEFINGKTQAQLPADEGIFIVPIGGGGDGISQGDKLQVIGTLTSISEEDAATVNGLITTDYEIISQNGYPT